ncbi:hypothetical protein [Paenibacillus sp. CF384]|uniref:hypothetical protein n=1 Tax=Paenibacillus sp. CF384 TaxID=1884382 RepID=UPI0008952A8F|nr:hypothetical protein [Paenibacillus sp. CF384]SDX71597.1 hypothetical protein SAMN05518855_101990 [Paenibacillus sp. CF384]
MLKTEQTDLEALLRMSSQSSDFKAGKISCSNRQLHIAYFTTLIDQKLLQEYVIQPIQKCASTAIIETLQY